MVAQILKSKAKSAFQTHSTWLSTQSTAITIVTLSGERRVGSVSRSIRRKSALMFDDFSNSHGDHQKVTSNMRPKRLIPRYQMRGPEMGLKARGTKV
jgi:hypothetical protein